MLEATLVFPHQLFETHPGMSESRPVWLIEDPLFFGNDPHWPSRMHVQKLVLHRASMKAYACELEAAGLGVHYLDLPDGSTTDSAELLDQHLPKTIQTFHIADPADHLILKRVRRFVEKRRASLVIHESPNFISPPQFLEAHLATKKKPFMAKFYENQRKRMALLLDPEGGPLGGKWSFDTENRAKLPKGHTPPREPRSRSNSLIQEATAYIHQKFPNPLGDTAAFRWPVTRQESEAWLEQFIDERLADFGLYEDAISTEHSYIYHAAITPMLNIGLLDPQRVIDRVVSKAARADIPMNSLEGFIRQVIGWREFMHGIYQHRGTEIRNGNFWNFDRPLPRAFYDGTTGIPPVDRVIKQLLRDGYCHHIERLMVLGNFMLLCRIKPDEVYRWFMELFVDSYDWVMVPNVYGMSQFADGGTFTTKPYISGSNYVLKMSNEPKGPWCAVWDGLFWSFIGDYAPFFHRNPRLSMMIRNWEKQSPGKQEGHRQAADEFLAALTQ
jgi:deoxyribodipyrimidine photolyase-related protein